MKKRVSLLLVLLLFRCILGYRETLGIRPGGKISVTGNTDNVYQNDSYCVVHVGRYILQSGGICAVYKNQRIRGIGTVSGGVITRFMGRISLDDAKIYNLDKYGDVDNSCVGVCDMINNLRDIFLNRIRNNVPEPESGLVAGIVLGYKKDIGQDLYEDMIESGTIHIAVASGYNVMLVGGMILACGLWIVKRRRATLVSILFMLIYAMMAGGDPPVIRAVWMIGLIITAQAIGRASSSTWILSLVVWVMLIWDPYLITDISFQLSVAASVGLIALSPWMESVFEKKLGIGASSTLSGVGVTTTLATMMLTAPLVWWHFGRMSLIGILSNTLILPLIPVIMILTGIMFVFGGVVAVPVYAVAHFVVRVIQLFGS